MSLFVIDRDKCNRDGLCVAACPAGLIKLTGVVPTPVDRAEERCINCGHCVAICPSGALSHRAMMPDQCLPISKGLMISPEQAEQFLLARRSIRSYKKEPVDREILTKIIQIASYAPTASNSQPVRWLVIHDPNEVKRMVGIAIDWMRSLAKENPRLGGIVSAWDAGTHHRPRRAARRRELCQGRQFYGSRRLRHRHDLSGTGGVLPGRGRLLGGIFQRRNQLLAANARGIGTPGGTRQLSSYTARLSEI